MAQYPSNAPMMEPSPAPSGWLPVWIKAVSQPNEQTYVSITEHPGATTRTALIWVFIAGTISGLVQAIVQTIMTATGAATQIPIPGLEEYMPPATGGDAGSLGMSLVIGLCLSPLAGLISVLGFSIFTAVIQWIAKLFGGVGTFEKLAYALAAITVPVTLVTSVLALLNAIPFIGICTGIISMFIGLYALVLEILAVKAVNRFGLGAAVGSVLIPALVLVAVCVCVVVASMAALAPLMGNVFEQSLPGFTP
jgi:hypothetical protein